MNAAARYRIFALLSGPLGFAAVMAFAPEAFEGAARLTLATTTWVAAWWILEALPLPVTSLLPVVLLPTLGLASAKDVAGYYMNDLLMLLLGGFLLAMTIERWGLHRRAALFVLGKVGTSPRRLVLGFLITAAVLSMWISNTATALMLLPIGLAVTRRLIEVLEVGQRRRFEISLLLAIAYGANIGGTGTYIGTPPNLVFRERFEKDFGAGTPGGPEEISFLMWIVAFAPMALGFLGVIWWMLARRLSAGSSAAAAEVLREESRRLPRWSPGEVATALVFATTALLWITRKPIEVGGIELLGWSRWFPEGFVITDGTVAITMVVVCFLIWVPSRPPAEDDPPEPTERDRRLAAERDGGATRLPAHARPWAPLLTWRDAEKRLPWGILLLYGGGFSLGETIRTSGLSQTLGDQLTGGLAEWSPLLIVGSICLLVTFLTEVTSNTASTNVILPILSAVAVTLELPAPLLLLPATLTASCAFMLPVATPTNAVVFSSGRVPIRAMVAHGFALNLAAVAWITLYLHYVGLPLLGVEMP